MKLLVISRFLPLRDLHGGCTYLADCLEALSQGGWEIECVHLSERPGGENRIWPVPAALRTSMRLVCPGNLRVGNHLIAWRGLKQAALLAIAKFGRMLGVEGVESPSAIAGVRRELSGDHRGQENLVSGPLPMTSDRLPEPFERNFAASRLAAFQPDAIMADFTFMAPVLPEGTERGVRVILTHDVLHERVQSFQNHGISTAWGAWSIEKEAALLRRADLLVAISEQEAESFRRICPEVPVVVAPMSTGAKSARPGEPWTDGVAGSCVFVGGGDAHNVHGLRWMLREVWPGVRARVPEATLHVCGSVCAEVSEPSPGVTFLGRVPDLKGVYADAAVCVVPILAGSGIKIKLVEALNHRCACVTTTAGLRGLEMLRDGLLVADEAADFAGAVVRLLTDGEARRELAAAGAALVAQRLSPSACYGPLARAVEALARAGRAKRTARDLASPIATASFPIS
ncbi:MAG: hypothetical protein JWO82_1428 [Akkermansiaceae bacterium]|nr:hypothetical protein [Akkermansiaceae bacterium]